MKGNIGPFDEEYEVVIVGAGIGGLVCGAALAQKGKRVKIIEQHSVPGGYCTSFKRKAFVFDSSIHAVMGARKGGRAGDVLSSLGIEKELDFVPLEPAYRAIFPGESFDVSSDNNEFFSALVWKFPGEKENIEKFLNLMERMAQDLEKMPSLSPLLTEYKDKVFQQLLDEYFQDDKLKSVVSSTWTWVGMPPSRMSALLMAELGLGGFKNYYPVGGAQALADTVVKALKRNGGDLELKTMAKKIIIDGEKAIGVETGDGKRIKAGWVVSNSDARRTFFKLVGKDKLPKEFASLLENIEVGPSAFNVYLGVKMDLKALGITSHENIVHSSFDSQEEYEDIMRGNIGSTYTITIPSLTDPALAPPGHHCLILFAPVPYQMEGKSWKQCKEEATEKLISKAEEVIPDLSRHIVVKDAATPLTLERYTLNSEGSVGGWAYMPETIFNRPQPKTPIENLYLTGHWTLPGGGIPGVISSGWMVSGMVLEMLDG